MAVLVPAQVGRHERSVRLPQIHEPIQRRCAEQGEAAKEHGKRQRQAPQDVRFRSHVNTNDGIFSRIRKVYMQKTGPGGTGNRFFDVY